MERKEFIKSCLGLCALSMVPVGILESCKKSDSTSAAANVNFTLDLTSSARCLNTVGGYVVSNGVIIVIRYNATTYEAYSAACTHEGQQVVYQSSNSVIYCSRHGATFDPATGAVKGGPASSALTRYNVSLSGTTLTVKS